MVVMLLRHIHLYVITRELQFIISGIVETFIKTYLVMRDFIIANRSFFTTLLLSLIFIFKFKCVSFVISFKKDILKKKKENIVKLLSDGNANGKCQNLEQRLQNNGKGNWKILQEQEKELAVGMSSN